MTACVPAISRTGVFAAGINAISGRVCFPSKLWERLVLYIYVTATSVRWNYALRYSSEESSSQSLCVSQLAKVMHSVRTARTCTRTNYPTGRGLHNELGCRDRWKTQEVLEQLSERKAVWCRYDLVKMSTCSRPPIYFREGRLLAFSSRKLHGSLCCS